MSNVSSSRLSGRPSKISRSSSRPKGILRKRSGSAFRERKGRSLASSAQTMTFVTLTSSALLSPTPSNQALLEPIPHTMTMCRKTPCFHDTSPFSEPMTRSAGGWGKPTDPAIQRKWVLDLFRLLVKYHLLETMAASSKRRFYADLRLLLSRLGLVCASPKISDGSATVATGWSRNRNSGTGQGKIR